MNRLAMEEKRQNVIVEKTEHFADRIIKMYSYLLNERSCNNQIVELKQVKRSGTSIGANTAEGQYAQTKADFLTKMTIALKEANETRFWLHRLHAGGTLSDKEHESIINDIEKIINILVKITGTTKKNLENTR